MVKYCSGLGHGEHSVLSLGVNCIYLKLATRKNKQKGSLLKRSCWCKKSPTTCPVHILGSYIRDMANGCPLFQGITKHTALLSLRRRLESLGVVGAHKHRTQDFRRGHAQDLLESGASLREILCAGEWRSPAFLEYLNLEKLEHDMVVQAHLDDSEDDE